MYFETRDNENKAAAYRYDLENKEYAPIQLMTNEPGAEPVSILAEAGNDYLVNYRCDRIRDEKDSVMIDENGTEHQLSLIHISTIKLRATIPTVPAMS